jgi:hypothetical protein
LTARGADVRVATRSSGTRFDGDDEETWEGAVKGASPLYLIAPQRPEAAAVDGDA